MILNIFFSNAQSNVHIETTKIHGVDIILMIAMQDIKKNESIGFSYGLMYWKHPSITEAPFLFTKKGQVLLPGEGYEYKETSFTKNSVASFKKNPFFSHLFMPPPKISKKESKLEKILGFFKNNTEKKPPHAGSGFTEGLLRIEA